MIGYSKKKISNSNTGFSLVELVVAIGILGVIGTIVAFMMTSSSKNYSRMSVEAQLQSEAQLVANAISELAIDSYDAEDLVAGSFGTTYPEYDNTAGKILLLKSVENKGKTNEVEYEYVIAKRADKDELYVGSRSKTASQADFGSYTFSLLGKYISDFSVDTSFIKNKKSNILNFKLSYTKNSRTYNGNYQVLMRNKAYSESTISEDTVDVVPKITIGLEPREMYIDVVGHFTDSSKTTTIDYPTGDYYINQISAGNKRFTTDKEYPLNSKVVANFDLEDDGVNWEMTGHDPSSFEMDVASNVLARDAYIKYISGADLKNSSIDDFTVQISKSATYKTETVSAAPKKCQIHLRRVKEVKVQPTTGVTEWKTSWNKYGTSTDEAASYVYLDDNSRYCSVNFNASVLHKYVPYGGGLVWTLQYKDANSTSSTWKTPPSSLAKLSTYKTDATTINTLIFGTGVENGQLYRVTAVSIFDGTKQGEYIVGIAPRRIDPTGGYNSRGFYTSLSEFFNGGHFSNNAIGSGGNPADLLNKKIKSVRLGAGGSSLESGKYFIVNPTDTDPNCYFFMDYGTFMYSNQQRKDFYRQSGSIELYITFTDNSTFLYYYNLLPVKVHDSGDTDSTTQNVVIEQGKSKNVGVTMDYYNIIGSDYIGYYVDDDSTYNQAKQFGPNLNGTNFDADMYLSTNLDSEYGSVKLYIENATVTLKAKNTASHCPTPITFRVAALDFYNCYTVEEKNKNTVASDGTVTNISTPVKAGGDNKTGVDRYTCPSTDYQIYIANVEGECTFISCPATTFGPHALIYPTAAKSATERAKVYVGGVKSDGTINTQIAQAYVKNGVAKIDYNGKTYSYVASARYWKRD